MKSLWSCFAIGMAVAAAAARADTDTERALRDEVAELKRQMSVMVDEVQQLKTGAVAPEKLKSGARPGLSPAGVYGGLGRGITLGGYAEALYSRDIADRGDDEDSRRVEADFTRAELYLGYKFNDWITYHQEIEIEHAFLTAEEDEGESPGEVSLEMAYLDFQMRPEFNVRAGLMTVPMGYLNDTHEPPFYYGTNRPQAERQILGATWRENGVGIFGTLAESVQYRFYVLNGLNANGFRADGLRNGRQRGARARANELAWVGRMDVEPLPGFQLGGSMYMGESSQDDLGLPRIPTRIWELHSQYDWGGWHLRALYTQANLGHVRELTRALGLAPTGVDVDRSIAKRMIGGYAEVAYDMLRWLRPSSDKKLAPFFRFEYIDPQNRVASGFTQNGELRQRLYIAGLQFWPHPNVVLKLDYRNIDSFTGNAADQFNVGIGLSF